MIIRVGRLLRRHALFALSYMSLMHIRTALWATRLVWREQPVPVSLLAFLVRMGPRDNPLTRALGNQVASGDRMSDPTLAHVLASDELGAWSLGIDALEFLRRQITDLKPQVVLEFGSGISTVCLARFMSLASDDARMLVSLEQDSAQATLSRNRLAGVPVSVDVRVHDAPLEVKTFEGAVFHAYRVDDLGRLLEGHKANLVLIDGPAAEAGARVCTVPSVLPFLQEGAWFFMDDALRPSEIWAARRWASDPRLDIDGVVLVGKGLLVGRVKDARPSNQSS